MLTPLAAACLVCCSVAMTTVCPDPSVCSAETSRMTEDAEPRAVGEAAQPSEPPVSVKLLQQGLALSENQGRAAQLEDGVPSPALQSALPVNWLHIPKCGTSFLNTLINVPGICSQRGQTPSLARHAASIGWFTSEEMFFRTFNEKYTAPWNCPGMEQPVSYQHFGMAERKHLERLRGHWMGFVRQPEQRLVSAYRDMRAAHVQEPMNLVESQRSWGGWPNNSLPTLRQFVDFASGCEVRMLTRSGMPCGGFGGPPSPQEVRVAKQRLQTDFAFIGLTEQWRLSICLFSAMFRVPCHSAQFEAFRTRRSDPAEMYDSEYLLEDVSDPYDTEVYSTAERIFADNLDKHNVSKAWCWEKCWGPAGLLDEEPQKTIVWTPKAAGLGDLFFHAGPE